jgi:hypothetical protein
MRLALAFALLGAAGCKSSHDSTPDAPGQIDAMADAPVDAAPPDANPLEPTTLLGTGLCMDAACTVFSPDVHEYTPQFPLWADGATKRRWIFLPPGTQIDTTDMDHWVFPQGTKLWKEFTRDGVRIETRYIVKELPNDNGPPNSWFYASYQWNLANDDTVLWDAQAGAQNVNGTQQDIPSRNNCKSCHENLKPSRVLGFQAIQLDLVGQAGQLDLDTLIQQQLLTAPPAGTTPHFPLPGSAIDQAAFGYLHANCGHCHNPTSNFINNTPMVLRLDTTKMASVEVTPTFLTTVNVTGSTLVDNGIVYHTVVLPQDPDDSIMIVRLNSTNPASHMPQLGSEVVDPDGQTALRAWIDELTP